MLILVILLFFRCMPSTGSDRFVGGTDLWNNRPSAPPPARAAGRNAPLIRFFISALHIVLLLYIVCFPLILFLHCFLTFLRPYLSFPLRIDPLRFQAGCRRRRLKLALVLLRLFCVVVPLF